MPGFRFFVTLAAGHAPPHVHGKPNSNYQNRQPPFSLHLLVPLYGMDGFVKFCQLGSGSLNKTSTDLNTTQHCQQTLEQSQRNSNTFFFWSLTVLRITVFDSLGFVIFNILKYRKSVLIHKQQLGHPQ
jgi:hypothetical protein